MQKKSLVGAISAMLLVAIVVWTFVLTHTVFKVKNDEQVTQEVNKRTIALTGDFLWEHPLYEWMDNYQYGSYFDQVKPYLESDLTIANHEVPIAGDELGISGVAFNFNAPYEIGEQLPNIGVDFVTFANNHTLDKGLDGINNTLDLFDRVGIQHTGAFRNSEEANQISVVDVEGVKVAILAYTYDTNEARLDGDYVPYFLTTDQVFDEEHQEKLAADIEKARATADMVFVAMHWGTEFTYELNETQVQVAEFLNQQGVDLVIGNHSHNIQPATTLVNDQGKETVVFYSLGNTVSAASPVDRASEDFTNMYEIGALVNLEIVEEGEGFGLDNIQIIPFVNHFEDDFQNFQMIPFKEYNEELASKHMQKNSSENFTYDWLKSQIHTVFDDSGFTIVE